MSTKIREQTIDEQLIYILVEYQSLVNDLQKDEPACCAEHLVKDLIPILHRARDNNPKFYAATIHAMTK